MRTPGPRVLLLLRTTLCVDAVVFLTAALLNFRMPIPLGLGELRFPDPLWQAGLGEAVIGVVLLAAAVTGRPAIAWVALGLSVAGIVVGLSSARVQGPAREIHLILVPLAAVVFALLLGRRRAALRLGKATSPPGREQ